MMENKTCENCMHHGLPWVLMPCKNCKGDWTNYKRWEPAEVDLGAGPTPKHKTYEDCNYLKFPFVCAIGGCNDARCGQILDSQSAQNDNLEIYERAVRVFGQRSQVNVAIEEMAELTKELCKLNRKQENHEHILEEIADVWIMLQQMMLIFDDQNCSRIRKYIDEKTQRLSEML